MPFLSDSVNVCDDSSRGEFGSMTLLNLEVANLKASTYLLPGVELILLCHLKGFGYLEECFSFYLPVPVDQCYIKNHDIVLYH